MQHLAAQSVSGRSTPTAPPVARAAETDFRDSSRDAETLLLVAPEQVVRFPQAGHPEEFLPHVFERFRQADSQTTRRHGGLGLGLYISRAIIDAHGGRIWAAPNTEDGAGSVFGFRIPRVAMPLAPAEVVPTGEPPPFVVRRRDGPE